MKNIVLLGASGSIGMQTIDVCVNHPHEFNIVGLSVGRNISCLYDILKRIAVKYVCVQEENIELVRDFPDIEFYFGDEGLLKLVAINQYDVLVNALVGFVGLRPTLMAIERGHDVALANKETLVVAGEFVSEAAIKHNVQLLPIDSEHSAIFQALQGNDISDVNKLIITASGGSFKNRTRSELVNVTVDEALKHPNWEMGAKITIDSATMMNKGFEVIEAHWLFNIPYDRIEVLLHPQSIIHSMVEYKDHSVMAQLGLADMRLPIQYALSFPKRLNLIGSKALDLATIGQLTFSKMDLVRFPLLKVAYEVGRAKGNAPCILNAANEIANKAFLDRRISFLDIEYYILDALRTIKYNINVNIEDIYKCDKETREYVEERILKNI